MSALRSSIQELVLEDLASVDDVSLEVDVAEIARVIGLLEAQKSRRVAEVDRRRSYARDGAVSMVAWLARTCDQGSGRAAREVGVSRRLDEMPLTREGFESGEIGIDKVTILTRAFEAHPEAFADAEEMLVGFVPQLTVSESRRAVAYWRHLADQELANADVMDMHNRSYLHLSRSWGGMVHIEGRLDPESGAIVIQAVAAATAAADRASDATARAGGRIVPAAQRRAHALVDLCRRSLDSGTNVVGGARPHIGVTVDYQTLTGRPGTTCELSSFETITPRRLADSPATPTSPASSPVPAPNPSTSDGPAAPSLLPSARLSSSATGAVPSHTATASPIGATATISGTGPTGAPPTWTIWCSSAVATTPSAMRVASRPAPIAPSPDPTEPSSTMDRTPSEPHGVDWEQPHRRADRLARR